VRNDLDLIFLFLVAITISMIAGYGIAYSLEHNKGYEEGYQAGITYQAQVDLSNIILGLIEIPGSGYYIVNHNYGNFKINVTDQTEALKYLLNEISPCLLEEYLCQQIKR